MTEFLAHDESHMDKVLRYKPKVVLVQLDRFRKYTHLVHANPTYTGCTSVCLSMNIVSLY